MARIDMTLDTSGAIGIHDEPCLIDPYEGAGWVGRGLRYCWVSIPGRDGDALQLHLANGLSTDEQIVASALVMVAAFSELIAAAQARIAAAAALPDGVEFVGTVGQFLEGIGA